MKHGQTVINQLKDRIIRASLILFLLSGILLPHSMFGSHLRAGEITAQQISCDGRVFKITVTVFIDMESGIKFGGEEDWLNFGDGDSVLIPLVTTVPRPDLGVNVGMATYSVIHTYASLSTYTISYSEPFRNEGIANINNSGTTKFFIHTQVSLDAFLSCNENTPMLKVAPIDRACVGVAFFHNPGAYDEDGDSLSFEMTIPRQSAAREVVNYREPSDPEFYFDYATGNEANDSLPGIELDPIKGTLVWDAPGKAGEYNIAFAIVEWREDEFGAYHRIGYVVRDMQIIVEDCDNKRPDLLIPQDLCVTAGTFIEEKFFGIDPENDKVKIEAFSEVFDLRVSPATYAPFPPGYQPSEPPAEMNFRWQTQCEHVKDQYYQVVLKITDDPSTVPSLVTFATWRIKVVAPAPTWQDIQPVVASNGVRLTWDPYLCEQADKMQVWRKVDSVSYNPATCETGMPALGYQLVATVKLRDPISQEYVYEFIDNNGGSGLAAGAFYCYRMVALFPEPKGGESYVSRDTCLIPVLMDAPVITHITVERTHAQQGATRISWQSPLDIDKTQFPGPYQYSVYRGGGFSSDDAILVDNGERISDTTFVDADLDTENAVYNYRIVLYSNSADAPAKWVAVDTSATASSVRLDIQATASSFKLSWRADVPWSNISERHPYHLIFRGTERADPDDYELIDSISSPGGVLSYEDNGQYQNSPLDPDEVYCYRVLTRGTYANPRLVDPLENFSQTICSTLDDEVRPCTPVLSLKTVDCDELFLTSQCTVKEFSNRIEWTTNCEDESRRFRIYSAPGPDASFTLLADNVQETFYLDRNLPSFARCYKITAIDVHGNESDFSDIVCSDNCPYFELPNVFTPNGDQCNDFFSAFGPFNPLHETAPESCIPSADNYGKCIRFVKRVSFSVFNRWGKEVYRTTDRNGENDQYINWDGTDNNGKELSTGIYYYIVRVKFDVIDPEKQEQTIKGWVHVVR